ncbi:MAG: sigma-54-dependent Fis family transcriptional regulator [Magnetococcales bacterium]|nr:sigma-54-dependent Fis family transcriptional regulator [Magnetococcales bacterium]
MNNDRELQSEEREFFTLLAEAIFINPFNDDHRALDALLPKAKVLGDNAHEHRLNAIAPVLDERIAILDRRGLNNIRSFTGSDRKIMEYAYLFQLYQVVQDSFDLLIEEQSKQVKKLVAVPFAEKLLSQMRDRGFSVKESLRYLALFYQFRRAYFFIVGSLVGNSSSMKRLRLALWNNVFTWDVRIYDRHLWGRMEDFSTLLLGETGSGKGAAAAAIGRSGFIPFDVEKRCFSENFMETFVAINLSQFPETLIESELFGHRKGAFSGAIDHYKGVFEQCSANGALFLDEIGDITPQVQIKLLKVVQERLYTPVGSRQEKRFSGRVIAATNLSLSALRKDSSFRDDFYYRLCSDEIIVPPLRQRIAEESEELPDMVSLLIKRATGEVSDDLTGEVLDALKRDLPTDYSWPGNVRELEQAVRRILLTRQYSGDPLAISDIGGDYLDKIQAGELTAKELLNHYCQLLYKRYGSYEEVARRVELDRRTVRKHVHG